MLKLLSFEVRGETTYINIKSDNGFFSSHIDEEGNVCIHYPHYGRGDHTDYITKELEARMEKAKSEIQNILFYIENDLPFYAQECNIYHEDIKICLISNTKYIAYKGCLTSNSKIGIGKSINEAYQELTCKKFKI
jgi:hypothetical protein